MPQARVPREISDTFVFGMLVAYFAVNAVLRVLASSNVQLDESQQLILVQELHWGYGSQPPLYTWLQHGVFQMLGVNVEEDTRLMDTFLKDVPVSFPILLDREGTASSAYRLTALPSTYFIDREGVIRAVVIGGPMQAATIQAHIQDLLEGE